MTRGTGTVQEPTLPTAFIRVWPVSFDGFAKYYTIGQHAVITQQHLAVWSEAVGVDIVG